MNNLSLNNRQQQRHQTQRNARMRLLNAALDVFSSKGIEGATVNDICHTAGYSKGGFYFHFRSKEDLVIELINVATGSSDSPTQEGLGWSAGLLADLLAMAFRKPPIRAQLARQYASRIDVLERRAARPSSRSDLDSRTLAELEVLLETGLQLQSHLLSTRDNHVKAQAFVDRLHSKPPAQPSATGPPRLALSSGTTQIRHSAG